MADPPRGKVNNITRKISFITLITNSQNGSAELTKHQLTIKPIREFYSNEQIEVWWDTKIKTITPVQHSKVDIVMWKKIR